MDQCQGSDWSDDSQLVLGGFVFVKLSDCLPPVDDKCTLYFDRFSTGLNLMGFRAARTAWPPEQLEPIDS